MSMRCLILWTCVAVVGSLEAKTRSEENAALLDLIKKEHGYDDASIKKLKAHFDESSVLSQGNPEITKRPLTPAECQQKNQQAKQDYYNKDFEKICGAKYMAPLFDPKTQKKEDAKACIDQFEFPNIPCTYPVVWVRADEAADMCEAIGKRLCDAHEWEGACAGALLEADYPFEAVKGMPAEAAIKKMRTMHNAKYDKDKQWAYGKAPQKGVCAMNSSKDQACTGGDWKRCGSNTYPTGSFSKCSSELKVYDLHGNAAEHMNLPTKPDEMASRGSKTLGYTEMKGSWFIWDKYAAHPDQCRWRAPFWHGSKVKDPKSHHNYHLGFRCCKSL